MRQKLWEASERNKKLSNLYKYEKFITKYPNHEMVESVKFELKYLGMGIKEIPELKHLTE